MTEFDSSKPVVSRSTPGSESHVALNLIARCNSRCVFCFEGDRLGMTTPTTEEANALLEEAASRAKSVVFMGGEALLRPDIVPLVGKAKELGLRTSLFTNGLALARPGLLSDCIRAGLDVLHVSVNAWDRASWARASGLPESRFDLFLQGLANLRAHFLENDSSLFNANFHVLSYAHNVEHLDKILALVLDRFYGFGPQDGGAKSLSFTPDFLFKAYKGVGRAGRSGELLVAPVAKQTESLRKISDKYGEVANIMFSGIPLCHIPGLEHLCLHVKYLAQGLRIDCNFESQSEIREMSLVEWEGVPEVFREKCRACSLMPLCLGPGGLVRPEGSSAEIEFPTDAPHPELPPEALREFLPVPSNQDPVCILVGMGVAQSVAEELVRLRQEKAAVALKFPAAARPHTRQRLPLVQGRLAKELEALLNSAWPRIRPEVDGYEVAEVRDATQSQILQAAILLFRKPDGEEFLLDVEECLDGQSYLARTHGHGLRFRKETPPTTLARQQVIRCVVQCLLHFEKSYNSGKK